MLERMQPLPTPPLLTPALEELKNTLGKAHDLGMASAVLGWEQETYMPHGGAGHRADQLATLDLLSHETFTHGRMGELLEELKPLEADGDAQSFDASLIRVTRRDYAKATRFPSEFVEEISRAQNAAHFAWMEARKQSDFKSFQPHLETMFDLA